MKRNTIAMAGLALVMAATSAWTATAKEAPKFNIQGKSLEQASTKMLDVKGKKVSIEDVAGKKGTLVVFTCNACPYAKGWEDRIAALGNEFSKKGVGVIAVNSNDPERVAEDSYEVMKDRAKELKLKFPYVVDDTSKVAKEFGATRTPEVFLFDSNGELVYHGAVDDNVRDASAVQETYLEDALTAVVGGEPVPVASTKAIGCTIKWRSGV